MARIEYVTDDVAGADALAALVESAERRGSVSNFHRTLAHVPEVLRAFEQFSAAVRATSLEPRLRELAILRVSSLLGLDYEWRRHCGPAMAAGLTDDQLLELGRWSDSTAFDEHARTVLEFVDAHVLRNHVDEAVVDRVRVAFGDAGVVGLAVSVGWYLFVNTVIAPLGLMQDDTSPPAPVPMPQPAVPAGLEGSPRQTDRAP